jgi:hypothetical protein
MNFDQCEADLANHGWHLLSAADCSSQDGLAAQVAAVAKNLGEIVPGRGRQHIEHIIPRDTASALAGSLSQKYGLAPLPLHTDTAHWTVPCRYLVMACFSSGPEPTPTILLDSKAVAINESESAACTSAVFLIRNGRASFYGSILSQDRPFIRFDLGCMVPMSPEGADAGDAFSYTRNVSRIYRHDWRRGDILVFDNWRMLHGRGIDRETVQGRVLLRAIVR